MFHILSAWIRQLYKNLICLTSLVLPFLGFVRLTERITVTVPLMVFPFTTKNSDLCPCRTTLAPKLRQAHCACERKVRNPLTIVDTLPVTSLGLVERL